MRIKDSTIICLLITSMIFMLIGILGLDTRLDDLAIEIGSVRTDMEEMEEDIYAELAEHENRLYLIEHNQEVMKLRLNRHYTMIMDMQVDLALHDDAINKLKTTPTPKGKSNLRRKMNVKVSQKDIRNISALVYLEAGSCSDKCKKAVASVIFNRMIRYNKTASQVIWQKGVFSVRSRVLKTIPSRSCIDAVKDVLKNGSIFPLRVTAFRNKHYHTFGKRYCCIDGVYFTYV